VAIPVHAPFTKIRSASKKVNPTQKPRVYKASISLECDAFTE